MAVAGLAHIKERFALRMHGNLPAPVAAKPERKFGQFENQLHDLRIDADNVCAEAAAEQIRLPVEKAER